MLKAIFYIYNLNLMDKGQKAQLAFNSEHRKMAVMTCCLSESEFEYGGRGVIHISTSNI